jgi:hypothetical protein
MSKDAVFRLRVPKRTLSAIKRVAKDHNTSASAWAAPILEAELRRDLAAIELREQLRAARAGRVSEEEAMSLALSEQSASRRG